MKKMSVLFMLAMAFGVAPGVFAQSNSVSLTQIYCPATTSEVGSLEVTWTTAPTEPDNVALFVYDFNLSTFDLSPAEVLAAARSGSAYPDWLEKGYSYSFELDSGLDSGLDYSSGTAVAGQSVTCG